MDIKKGTYTSANGQFILTITEYDAGTSTFKGTYACAGDTPQGKSPFTFTGGHWYHVSAPGGVETAVSISFTATTRPSNYSYCIIDSWVGIFTDRGVISAGGVRSYLLAGEPHELTNLGTHTWGTGTSTTGSAS